MTTVLQLDKEEHVISWCSSQFSWHEQTCEAAAASIAKSPYSIMRRHAFSKFNSNVLKLELLFQELPSTYSWFMTLTDILSFSFLGVFFQAHSFKHDVNQMSALIQIDIWCCEEACRSHIINFQYLDLLTLQKPKWHGLALPIPFPFPSCKQDLAKTRTNWTNCQFQSLHSCGPFSIDEPEPSQWRNQVDSGKAVLCNLTVTHSVLNWLLEVCRNTCQQNSRPDPWVLPKDALAAERMPTQHHQPGAHKSSTTRALGGHQTGFGFVLLFDASASIWNQCQCRLHSFENFKTNLVKRIKVESRVPARLSRGSQSRA